MRTSQHARETGGRGATSHSRMAAAVMLLCSLLIVQHGALPSSCSSGCQPVATAPAQPLSLSPTRGPAAGGQRLRVEGLNLGSVSGIMLLVGSGAVACTDARVMADNLVECTTGPAPSAKREAKILLEVPCTKATDDAGRFHCQTSRLRYEYVDVAVHSITPEGGPPSGGTTVTVRGSGLDLNQLKLHPFIGGVPCTALNFLTVGEITCVTPPLEREVDAGTPLPLVVGLDIGERPTAHPTPATITHYAASASPLAFTYFAAPRISSISPAAGPIEGGMTVTTRGAHLDDVTSVSIKGVACAYVKQLEPLNAISCMTTRAVAGTGPIEIATRRGGSSKNAPPQPSPPTFRYAHFPQVDVVTPSAAPVAGGTVVAIQGSRFGERPPHLLAIVIGGHRCRTLTWSSASEVGCTLPSMYSADGSAVNNSVDVIVHIAPPATGAAERRDGTSVAAAAAAADASADDRAATEQVAEQMAGMYAIDGGSTDELSGSLASMSRTTLTLLTQPRLSSIVPAAGPMSGGTALTIHGMALGASKSDVLEITLGTSPCVNISHVSNKELRCVSSPATEHGWGNVAVRTGSRGTSIRLPPPPTFTYLPNSPFDARAKSSGSAAAAEDGRRKKRPAASPDAAESAHTVLNLAHRATASGSCCGRLAAAAVDGDPSTDWRSPYEGDTNLTIELRHAEWLGAIDVHWGWGYRPTSWELLVSHDGEAWTPLATEVSTAPAEALLAAGVAAEASDATAVVDPQLEPAAVSLPASGEAPAGVALAPPMVSCGRHVAASCALCPACGGAWCGPAWCEGDCRWHQANATCVEIEDSPVVQRERRGLVSAGCRREQTALPRPWRPSASRLRAVINGSSGSDGGAMGRASACVAARYVRLRLRAESKRIALRDETMIIKELIVLPLYVMIDGETAAGGGVAGAEGEGEEEEEEKEESGGGGEGESEGESEEAAADAVQAGGATGGDAAMADSFLPAWAQSVMPLLRDGYRFEAIGVGGLDKELSQLFRRVVTPRLVPPSMRVALNLQLVRGVLLHGPPGTGKTLTARKIGSLLRVPEERTTVVDGPALVSKFLGESEKNMRDLFAAAVQDQQRARGATKGGSGGGGSAAASEAAERLHVIIFDEIDAICRSRGHADEQAAGHVYDSLVNQLLSIMDGVAPLDNVLLIGMTNRKDLIDAALLRPGRFEVELALTLPSLEGREQILRIHTKQLRERQLLVPGMSLAQVARDTSAFSGAALAGLVKSATSLALSRLVNALPDNATQLPASSIQLSTDDFNAAIREVRKARGATREDLRRLRGPLLVYSEPFERAWETGVRLVLPVVVNGGNDTLWSQ